ncbi:hypothetical protein X994_6565 (plasmid) [Burkholderia pseudomallei]|uniref:Uncharacterized protein n=1 Tax=Burkholderia pseudomallei TaxID=28450 RepID=A0AA40JIY6_BURPE|nr:hypothetical protein X994_6565 [Burkholderia pseudomallei]KGS72889.1 hypothetical protein X942_5952 [Burkholderia pseudomallei MSHR5596]KGW74889.1 hypothetical protein Y046_5643 [Burkholderia pseudomallei MSHR2990]KGX17106.1 hypothetical protein Y036_6185 [Burkholderia pseudomallei]
MIYSNDIWADRASGMARSLSVMVLTRYPLGGGITALLRASVVPVMLAHPGDAKHIGREHGAPGNLNKLRHR